MHVVGPALVKNSIRLSTQYDYTSRLRLMTYLQHCYKATKAENRGMASLEFFHKKLFHDITNFQSHGNYILEFASERWVEYSAEKLTPRTIGNLFSIKPSQFMGIHLATMKFLEAHAQVTNAYFRSSPLGASFLADFAKRLALFYLPTSGDNERLPLESYQGIYLAENASLFIPGPRDLHSLALKIAYAGPQASYFYCYLAISPRDFDCIEMSLPDKSSFGGEIFTGIAVRTNDGIICHLCSENINSPLVIFILELNNATVESILISTIAFDSPGYIREYISISRSKGRKISDFFDNIAGNI